VRWRSHGDGLTTKRENEIIDEIRETTAIIRKERYSTEQ
jgi:hypothetical protein